jgi:hypothetical protein
LPKSAATTYADVLAAGLNTILTNLGFKVADFSFNHLVRDARLREQVETEFSTEDAGKVLLHAPHLFVMHNKLDPTKGVFFVRCASTFDAEARSFRLTEDEFDTYRRFYPTKNLMVVVGRRTAEPEILASWLDDLSLRREGRYFVASILHMNPFETVVKKRFGMELQSEEMKEIRGELSKVARRAR